MAAAAGVDAQSPATAQTRTHDSSAVVFSSTLKSNKILADSVDTKGNLVLASLLNRRHQYARAQQGPCMFITVEQEYPVNDKKIPYLMFGLVTPACPSGKTPELAFMGELSDTEVRVAIIGNAANERLGLPTTDQVFYCRPDAARGTVRGADQWNAFMWKAYNCIAVKGCTHLRTTYAIPEKEEDAREVSDIKKDLIVKAIPHLPTDAKITKISSVGFGIYVGKLNLK